MRNTVIIGVCLLIFLYWLGHKPAKANENQPKEEILSDIKSDPWSTTKIHDMLIKTPDELNLFSSEIPENFKDITTEMNTYSIRNSRYYLMCQSILPKYDTKDYNLDQGAEGMINNVLFTYKCKEMKFDKLNSRTDYVVYEAVAKCNSIWKVMDLKVVLINKRVYSTFVLYEAADSAFIPIAEKILNSISKLKASE
jgi:hypothetical protein